MIGAFCRACWLVTSVALAVSAVVLAIFLVALLVELLREGGR